MLALPASVLLLGGEELLLLGGNVTLVGDPDGSSVLDAGKESRVLHVAGGRLLLLGVGILGGNARSGAGGALLVKGDNASVALEGGRISGSEASQGGCVAVVGGAFVQMKSVILTAGIAQYVGGGVLVYGSSLVMEGGRVENCSVTFSSSNQPASGGGVSLVVAGNATLTDVAITNCTVTSALSQAEGGGVHVDKNSLLVMEGGTVVRCTAHTGYNPVYLASAYGGGVSVAGGSATLRNVSFLECTSTSVTSSACGGGLMVGRGSTVTMVGGRVEACEASTSYTKTSVYGGGMAVNNGIATLTDVAITGCIAQTGNNAFVYGGGMAVNNGVATLTDVAITGCVAQSVQYSSVYGGGMWVDDGNTTLVNVTIADCNAAADQAFGGGIWVLARLIMEGGRVENCAAIAITQCASGGGIELDGGNVTLTSVTIAGCSATSRSGSCTNGGGINMLAGSMTMKDGQIKNCKALYGNGGGMEADGGVVRLQYVNITACVAGYAGGIGARQSATLRFLSCAIIDCTGNLPNPIIQPPQVEGTAIYILAATGVQLNDVTLRGSLPATGSPLYLQRYTAPYVSAAKLVIEMISCAPAITTRATASPLALRNLKIKAPAAMPRRCWPSRSRYCVAVRLTIPLSPPIPCIIPAAWTLNASTSPFLRSLSSPTH